MINDNLQHVLSQTVQACNIKTSMSDSEGCDSVRVPSKNHNMWQFFHAVGMYHHLCLCFIDVFATIVADLCSDLQFPPPPQQLTPQKTPPCHAKRRHRYWGCDGKHVSDACTPQSSRSDKSYGYTPRWRFGKWEPLGAKTKTYTKNYKPPRKVT